MTVTRSHPIIQTSEGVTRQVLADHPDMMVVAFRFSAEGAVGVLHDHPHVQSTYVESGRFEFTLGDTRRIVGPGESFVIPSGQAHDCVYLAPETLIDTFMPRRNNFISGFSVQGALSCGSNGAVTLHLSCAVKATKRSVHHITHVRTLGR